VGGGTATATFRIAAGCEGVELALISYQKTNPPVKFPQRFIEGAGSVFGYDKGAYHHLTVGLAHCSPQADLYAVGPGFQFGEDLTQENHDAIYVAMTLDYQYSNEECRP
jgi:hypothetical protein